MKAIIRGFYGNPHNPTPMAEVILDETTGEAKIVTNILPLKQQLEESGVVGAEAIRYYPATGIEFITALPIHFSSAYCRAEIVA